MPGSHRTGVGRSPGASPIPTSPSPTRPWLARALWPATPARRARWAELAQAACAQVTEDDDNEIVLSDLETLPAGI